MIPTGWIEVKPGVFEKPKARRLVSPDDAVDRERDLHDDVEDELKRRRWYYCHSRMDKRTTTQLGVTDFIIAAPNGITIWCELKRKNGKLSVDQNITRHVLLGLDHHHMVAFSLNEFIQKVDEIIQSVAQSAVNPPAQSTTSPALHPEGFQPPPDEP